MRIRLEVVELVTDYKALLEHSYAMHSSSSYCKESRAQYLSQEIFNFKTYSDEMDSLFSSKAVEVCEAITNRTTFGYIKDQRDHEWFLIMCNMPFFADRISWGSSIRSAFWEPSSFETLGLWHGDEQITESIDFELDDWESFMRALIEFAGAEEKDAEQIAGLHLS